MFDDQRGWSHSSGRPARLGRCLAAALVLTGLSACATPSTSPPPSPPPPSPVGRESAGPTISPSPGPASPELLPAAGSPGVGAGLSCGGPTFPAAGLNAPPGVEKASGPEFDALRATLTGFASAFPGLASWSWRLVGQDATDTIFLARTGATTDTGLISVDVMKGPNGWQVGNIGDCHLRVVLSAEYGPASWALNPAYLAPDAGTTTLEILVWEVACSGAAPTIGRMSAPVIDYATSTVTITLGVRPLQGPQTCPLGPGTPASVRLSQPLGNRTLLDGGTVPPAAPAAPGG
jgi:hypothetical protein